MTTAMTAGATPAPTGLIDRIRDLIAKTFGRATGGATRGAEPTVSAGPDAARPARSEFAPSRRTDGAVADATR